MKRIKANLFFLSIFIVATFYPLSLRVGLVYAQDALLDADNGQVVWEGELDDYSYGLWSDITVLNEVGDFDPERGVIILENDYRKNPEDARAAHYYLHEQNGISADEWNYDDYPYPPLPEGTENPSDVLQERHLRFQLEAYSPGLDFLGNEMPLSLQDTYISYRQEDIARYDDLVDTGMRPRYAFDEVRAARVDDYAQAVVLEAEEMYLKRGQEEDWRAMAHMKLSDDAVAKMIEEGEKFQNLPILNDLEQFPLFDAGAVRQRVLEIAGEDD